MGPFSVGIPSERERGSGGNRRSLQSLKQQTACRRRRRRRLCNVAVMSRCWSDASWTLISGNQVAPMSRADPAVCHPCLWGHGGGRRTAGLDSGVMARRHGDSRRSGRPEPCFPKPPLASPGCPVGASPCSRPWPVVRVRVRVRVRARWHLARAASAWQHWRRASLFAPLSLPEAGRGTPNAWAKRRAEPFVCDCRIGTKEKRKRGIEKFENRETVSSGHGMSRHGMIEDGLVVVVDWRTNTSLPAS